jgi:hypothetical protein
LSDPLCEHTLRASKPIQSNRGGCHVLSIMCLRHSDRISCGDAHPSLGPQRCRPSRRLCFSESLGLHRLRLFPV